MDAPALSHDTRCSECYHPAIEHLSDYGCLHRTATLGYDLTCVCLGFRA